MAEFWQGKRVIVTGGAGFLGSHLCEKLVHLGAQVTILDDGSRGTNAIDGAELFLGDAGNYDICREHFEGCDVVFNLAAHVAGLLYNRSHQFEMFERNVRLQLAPVRAARDLGIPHFLQVSSVCVYAPEHAVDADEERGWLGEPVQGNAGYSWAKRIGERAALWAGLPHCVIVRPSNMYGPRDYFDERAHVIPNLINKCLGNEPAISMKSPPVTKREFLYVEDAAHGIISAIENGRSSEIYNIGTHGETCVSLKALLDWVQSACRTNKSIEWIGGQEAGDPARWSNCTKARYELGFYPSVSLVDGLHKTVDWFIGRGIDT